MKLSDALDTAGDALAANWRRPEYRAGLAATVIVSGLLAPTRVRFIPAMLTAMAAGYGTERLYVVIGDVHKAALVAQDRLAISDATADAA